MKPALLIIDLQVAFAQGEAAKEMEMAVAAINPALEMFRAKNLPIVWVQHSNVPNKVVPGAPGYEFIPALKPLEGEKHIHKKYGNAFTKTDLEEFLRNDGVDTLILSGYAAEYCVTATMVGANDRDLKPILFRGGIAGRNAEGRIAVERAYDVASIGAIAKMLENC